MSCLDNVMANIQTVRAFNLLYTQRSQLSSESKASYAKGLQYPVTIRICP